MNLLSNELRLKARKSTTFARTAFRVGSEKLRERYQESRLPTGYSPRVSDRFVAAGYFAAQTNSVYQIEQWLWPFEQFAEDLRERGYGPEPFGILVRNPAVAEHLRDRTDLPVRFSRLFKGMEQFFGNPELRIVYYVNQSMGNFQALRFARPAHVHLSHGESEKISMISNQLKAYDYVFTAGQAARDRIESKIIGLDESRMFDVGRPQLDRPRVVPQDWSNFEAASDRGKIVFYAPTWEGDSNSMAYGTLAHNGATLVNSMLDSGYRVIFRPHPRTGMLRSDFSRALNEVEEIVSNHSRGFLDLTPGVSWQFEVADVAVAEMSSVAFDWLSTKRPLILIRPHNPGAELRDGGLFDRCPTVSPGNAKEIVGIIEAQIGEEESISELSEYYLGRTSTGDQLGRFVDASNSVIAIRQEELKKIRRQ